MSSVKILRMVARDPMEFDTHLYDPGVACDPAEGRTKQEFADECDINKIMARYEKTGVIDHVNFRAAAYGDFSSVATYHDAMNVVVAADAAFAALDARTRDRFGNDPVQMLKFLEDPANREEAIALGLVNPPAVPPEPVVVRMADPPPDPAPQPPAAPQGA